MKVKKCGKLPFLDILVRFGTDGSLELRFIAISVSILTDTSMPYLSIIQAKIKKVCLKILRPQNCINF